MVSGTIEASPYFIYLTSLSGYHNLHMYIERLPKWEGCEQDPCKAPSVKS